MDEDCVEVAKKLSIGTETDPPSSSALLDAAEEERGPAPDLCKLSSVKMIGKPAESLQ